jgi:hypothetical protein
VLPVFVAVASVAMVALYAILPAWARAATGSSAKVAAATGSETFWALDWGAGVYSQIQATPVYAGEHCVVYKADGALFHPFLADALGTIFDTAVYPALTEAYGPEPRPGIDGDLRVAILVYDFRDATVDGSFNYRDIDPGNSTRSNRREMFYLNAQALAVEPQNMGALAAHEFAHLIIHYRDVMLDPSPSASAESTWLVEGLATYAEHLAGYDGRAKSQLKAFVDHPDTSLTLWTGWRQNYGASYAFVSYLAERQGRTFLRTLIDQPLDGITGINAALGGAGTFDELYDDWVVANFLDGRAPASPPYAYSDLTVSAQARELSGAVPLVGTAEATDFGAVYLDFPATPEKAAFQAVVDGADGAPLQAALISWDSEGVLSPSVIRLRLANPATASTVTAPAGYDRHTLAVWARSTVGAADSFGFRYSGSPDPPGGVQFLDMGGGDPYYKYVATLLARGVVSGREVPSGSGLWFFMGRDAVLRAQFAKMIMESVGLHTPEIERLGTPSFHDVRPTYDKYGYPQAYPYDYVEEAAALGIVTGYAGGIFRPYSPITRSQLILMITRGAAAAHRPLATYVGSRRVFADVPTSHPRYREIMTAYEARIFDGSPGGDGRLYFYPDSSAGRNHVAKMTANLCGYLGR